jgi:3',5'-cyclic-AMP phosphodiesterase
LPTGCALKKSIAAASAEVTVTVGRAVSLRRVANPPVLAALAAIFLSAAWSAPQSFGFIILGDRTGETEPGIYEQVWREAAAANPAFVVGVGDTIQGLNDAKAGAEWRSVEQLLAPWRRIPLYLAPGNHDIWSAASGRLFEQHAHHPPHYSFDYAQAHFTVLDNSRTGQFTADEMAFLESDLKAHAAQPLKFIVSHRPSWIFHAAVGDPAFPLHQLATRYGVDYIIAGHLHQMLHYRLDAIDYVSMVSSGGHLRDSKKYQDGWFFGYAAVDVHGSEVTFRIHELKGRVTDLNDWGPSGRRAAMRSRRSRLFASGLN